MKKRFLLLACLLGIMLMMKAQNKVYDVVIVGGTPGGIMTAISAAREGKNTIILERTKHIGGLPANGLGATDITTRDATTGLFKQFVNRIKKYYIGKYGENSEQVKDCSDGYHFEPSVAETVFHNMNNEYSERITILYNRQFDSAPSHVQKQGNHIKSILIKNLANGKEEIYQGKVFIDATYEGDLGAACEVPFKVGRESRAEYGEVCAGKVYRYWGVQFNKGIKSDINGYDGYDSEGTTYQGDNAIQAYNYRLCLTQDAENMRAIAKPQRYNREEFISLIEDVWTGRNTSVTMLDVTPEMLEANREHIKKGNKTNIPSDPWGIAKITNMVKIPNGKTDANNQHFAFISTDLPEENWPWPTASWEWRDKFAQRLKEYTLGLIWFVQNDQELPSHFRKACKAWGLSTTEYQDNDNFPRQVYVREGRRMEGKYFFTANDALAVADGQRPPIHSQSITACHYALDSHATFKREKNRVHLEGFFGFESVPYTVPLGVMQPKKIENLLFPVPVSGSHVGFSTLRMEPCWMALGEAAGITASEIINEQVPAFLVNVEAIQNKLLKQGVTLIYYKDVKSSDANFNIVQYMGIRGYLPDWYASLEKELTQECRIAWEKRSGYKIPINMKTRQEALTYLYNLIK